jgi:hypothetical protein
MIANLYQSLFDSFKCIKLFETFDDLEHSLFLAPTMMPLYVLTAWFLKFRPCLRYAFTPPTLIIDQFVIHVDVDALSSVE